MCDRSHAAESGRPEDRGSSTVALQDAGPPPPPRVEAYILAAILARKQAIPALLFPRKHTAGIALHEFIPRWYFRMHSRMHSCIHPRMHLGTQLLACYQPASLLQYQLWHGSQYSYASQPPETSFVELALADLPTNSFVATYSL